MVHPTRTWIKVCFVVSRSRRFLLQKQMLSSKSWMSPTPFSAAALIKDTNWNTSNPQTNSIPGWSQDMLMWLKAQGMEDEIVFYLLLPLPVLARHPPLGYCRLWSVSSVDLLQVPQTLQGRNGNPCSLTMVPPLTLHLILFPILIFFQCKEDQLPFFFLRCS